MDIITPNFPAVRKPINEMEFCGWIGQAAPGDILQYHRGHLALDVAAHGHLSETERAELSRVARRAWWAADRGLLYLLQRRHKSHDYTYLAVARARRVEAVSACMLVAEEAA